MNGYQSTIAKFLAGLWPATDGEHWLTGRTRVVEGEDGASFEPLTVPMTSSERSAIAEVRELCEEEQRVEARANSTT